jgi:hypothetical protein
MAFLGFCDDPVEVSWYTMTSLDRARRVISGLLVFFYGLVVQANAHANTPIGCYFPYIQKSREQYFFK